ncbi:MAG: HypC/HybG/HupF family hydrogenase formation chaperone [Thermomicrobiales bacterium]
MCLPLIAQVQSVDGSIAEIRLLEGQITKVNTTLTPEVMEGEYVLVDRGMIIEIVSEDQVQEMLQFYQELTDMWAVEDAAHV